MQLEIREGFRTVPSRPIAVVLALLAVLALALTSWYVFSVSVPTRSIGNDRPNVTRVSPQSCDPYSPRDPVCQFSSDPFSPRDPA
ncbi:MAG TPA: hypothetical protein VEM94_10305 [Candidatus Dormibacteraeota bacterium]|nr:hypothetical protein [Candidatus Dormibacteraeota bacterium]